MWLMTDITAMKAQQAHVEHIAFHDVLTGLPNRLLLQDRMRQAMAIEHRLKRKMLVCFLDLDGFKAVNDSHGHTAGDQLLKVVAGRMRDCLRSSDTVARLGGDEFVLLLSPLQNAEEGLAVVQRLVEAVALPVTIDDEVAVQVSASIGVALYPDDELQPDRLLERADAAMYDAKRQGKNRVSGFGGWNG